MGLVGPVSQAGAGALGGAAGTAGATAGASGLTSAGITAAAPASALSSITPTIDAAAGIAGAGLPAAGGISGVAPIPGITTPGIVEGTVNPVLAAPMQQATQLPQLSAGMGPGGFPEIGMANAGQVPIKGIGDMTNLDISRGMYHTPNSSWVEQTYRAQPTTGLTAEDIRQVGDSFIDPTQVIGPLGNAPELGMGERFSNWYGGLSTPAKVGYGIAGGVGLKALTGGLNQPTLATEEEEENPFGFATFNRDKFAVYDPRPNVYKPAGMAAGGIAAAAPNRMFPQGMQNNAQYAMSSQMPTSAEVVNADYGALTDPYTGQMMRMAEGGKTEDKTPVTAAAPNVATRAAIDQYLTGRMTQQPAQPAAAQPTTPTDPSQMNMSQFQNYLGGLNRRDRAAAIQQFGFGDMYGSPRNYGPAGWYGNPGMFGYQGMPPMAMASGMYGKGATSRSFMPQQAPDDYLSNRFQVYTPQSPTVNTNVYRPGYAAGGAIESTLGSYAAGGNPRLLKGPGDGMSDHIPAVIGGKQPARLAEGEFVVPADVVSHLGNGSTDAGAKKLYNMMDKVRKARTGTKKQGRQIKADKFLPA
jgi:hypothetical protein